MTENKLEEIDKVAEVTERPIGQMLTASALDMDPAEFAKGLDRRKANRDKLLEWLKEGLTEGEDYGKIHVMPKAKCSKGKNCTDPNHFSRPTLFKSGAEKIQGYLGLTSVFPHLKQWEEVAMSGNFPESVLLQCQLINPFGQKVGEGMGARILAQDKTSVGLDLNKSIKMAKKSALIDAVLSVGGLSEVYTQDIDQMKKDGALDDENQGQQDEKDLKNYPDNPGDYKMPLGQHKGLTLDEISKLEDDKVPNKLVGSDYADWLANNIRNDDVRAAAKAWLEMKSKDVGKLYDDEISAENIGKIEKLQQHEKITTVLAEKINVWLRGSPTNEEARKLIKDMQDRIGEGSITTEDTGIEMNKLIALTEQKWNKDKPFVVDNLNKEAARLFKGVKVLEDLNLIQIQKMAVGVESGEIDYLPF